MQMTTPGVVVAMQPVGMLELLHLPPVQIGFAPEHTVPHLPQFWLSLCVSAQYGVPPSGVQTACCDVHCEAQPPSEHAVSGPEQTVPHAPQFALSVETFAQYAVVPPSPLVHSVWSTLHELTQLPFEQSSCTPHALPHVPQFALSVFVFVQNGTPPSGVHFVSACEHELLQLPAWQNWPG